TVAYPKDPLSASVTRKINGTLQTSNGLPTGSPEKKVNASNVGFLHVTIVDAGEYEVKITISDKVNYEWAETTPNQDPKTVSLKVNPKQLTLSYETDYKDENGTANNTVLSWRADQNFTAEFVIDGIYNGNATLTPPTVHDNIEVSVKLTRDNDSSFTPLQVAATYDSTSTGSYGKHKVTIDKNKFPGGNYAIGTYTITFELTDTNSHPKNVNYSLTTALQSWTNKLIISASSAGLDKYVFKYTTGDGTNQGAPQEFKKDASGEYVYKVPYAYDTENATGLVYKIEVDTTDFADANIAVDTDKDETKNATYVGWVNGYFKGQASKAGTYAGKVALKTTDPNSKFTLSNGTQSSTTEISITWEIEKQTVDLNGLTWQYLQDGQSVVYAKYQPIDSSDLTKGLAWHYAVKENGATVYKAVNNGTTITNGLTAVPGLPWKGTNYTLTLGNLPDGVTVKTSGQPYNGNQDKFVTTGANKVASVAANGLQYDTTNYNTVTIPSLEWRIVKAQIVLNENAWDVEEQGEGDGIFYLPQLTSDYSGTGIEYKYYEVTDSAETEIAVEDIISEGGTIRNYYVVPVLASGVSLDGTGKWNEVLEFVDEDGNVIDTTTPAGAQAGKKDFSTGDTRTVVSVSGKYTVTYDGKEHGIRVQTVGGKQVGEIEIKINSLDFKDVELKYYEWLTDGSKGTQLSSAPVDAGKYIIEPVLTGSAAEDYVLSKKQIVFEIEPFTFDLSGVKWGYIDEVVGTDENGNPKTEEVEVAYDPAQGLSYRVQVDENGAPVLDSNQKPMPKAYTPVLIGLPKGDANGDDEAKLLWDLFHASGFVSTDSSTGLGGYLTYT
ncbi:MAG: hypothetical protein K2N74_04870, partial [Clostridiales bacterium]|nr:hypothetical protein [Clostridiales bacterium]